MPFHYQAHGKAELLHLWSRFILSRYVAVEGLARAMVTGRAKQALIQQP